MAPVTANAINDGADRIETTSTTSKMSAPMKKGDLTDSEQKLIQCINDGKSEEAAAFLGREDVRPNCLDEHGMTLLQHAAYKGQSDLCQALLSHGADVNDNNHEHGYSTLMFAALSGKKDVTKIILEAGANVNSTNNVGRTATQMAAFVGQHQVVSLINNFFSKADLEYYTIPRGLESEAKLPSHLVNPMYKFILMNNLNPVKLSMYLQATPVLLAESKKVIRVLDTLVEKMMKQKFTNEVMAIKFHYLSNLVTQTAKSLQEKNDNMDIWIKRLLKARVNDGCQEDMELFVRSTFKTFPYPESSLLQQMVRTIANTKIGDDPTGLTVLTQGINGQRMASEDDLPCTTCNEFGAMKKCSACKMTNYCNQNCQKLHWFTHKKFCKKLAELHKKMEEDRIKQEAENEERERKRLEEEKLAKNSDIGGNDDSEIKESEEKTTNEAGDHED